MTSEPTPQPCNTRRRLTSGRSEPERPEFTCWRPDGPETASGPPVPPCPDGNDQRLVEIVGFRLKGVDYLQLRVIEHDGDRGICHVTVEENPDEVRVLAAACLPEPDHESWRRRRPPGALYPTTTP